MIKRMRWRYRVGGGRRGRLGRVAGGGRRGVRGGRRRGREKGTSKWRKMRLSQADRPWSLNSSSASDLQHRSPWLLPPPRVDMRPANDTHTHAHTHSLTITHTHTSETNTHKRAHTHVHNRNMHMSTHTTTESHTPLDPYPSVYHLITHTNTQHTLLRSQANIICVNT